MSLFNQSDNLGKIKEWYWPYYGNPPHAEVCPICYGKGQVNNVHPGDTCTERWETCHGCAGSGWITVR